VKKFYLSHVNILTQPLGVSADKQHALPGHVLQTVAVYSIAARSPTHASVKFRKRFPKAAPTGSYLVASASPPADFPADSIKEVS
jgi:hypothetical protein